MRVTRFPKSWTSRGLPRVEDLDVVVSSDARHEASQELRSSFIGKLRLRPPSYSGKLRCASRSFPKGDDLDVVVSKSQSKSAEHEVNRFEPSSGKVRWASRRLPRVETLDVLVVRVTRPANSWRT